MWDFTHTCTPNDLTLTCEFLPLCGSWTSPTRSPLSYGLFLHQVVIHGPFICHPWKSHVNLAHISMETPQVHIHGNLAPHHYLAPLSTLICWVFSRSFMWALWAYLERYTIHTPIAKGTRPYSICERVLSTHTPSLLQRWKRTWWP